MTTTADGTRRCTACAHVGSAGDRFCPACGLDLDAPTGAVPWELADETDAGTDTEAGGDAGMPDGPAGTRGPGDAAPVEPPRPLEPQVARRLVAFVVLAGLGYVLASMVVGVVVAFAIPVLLLGVVTAVTDLRVAPPDPLRPGSHSFVAALLLAIFLGTLGAPWFLLRRWVPGAVRLATWATCLGLALASAGPSDQAGRTLGSRSPGGPLVDPSTAGVESAAALAFALSGVICLWWILDVVLVATRSAHDASGRRLR